MTKIILGVALLFFTVTAQAQITETDGSAVASTIGSFYAALGCQGSLNQKIKDGDTTIILSFKNYSDKDLHHISFNEKGGTLNSLYNILASFFYPENKKNKNYKRSFKLGEEDITCTIETTGRLSVIFSTDEGFFLITEKQLDKLFGK